MTMNIPSTSTDNCDEGDSCWSKDIPEVTKTAVSLKLFRKYIFVNHHAINVWGMLVYWHHSKIKCYAHSIINEFNICDV